MKREAKVDVRLRRHERDLLERAARTRAQYVSEFTREVAVKAARRVVRKAAGEVRSTR